MRLDKETLSEEVSASVVQFNVLNQSFTAPKISSRVLMPSIVDEELDVSVDGIQMLSPSKIVRRKPMEKMQTTR